MRNIYAQQYKRTDLNKLLFAVTEGISYINSQDKAAVKNTFYFWTVFTELIPKHCCMKLINVLV